MLDEFNLVAANTFQLNFRRLANYFLSTSAASELDAEDPPPHHPPPGLAVQPADTIRLPTNNKTKSFFFMFIPYREGVLITGRIDIRYSLRFITNFLAFGIRKNLSESKNGQVICNSVVECNQLNQNVNDYCIDDVNSRKR